jgi:hypothetical protein
MLTPYARRLHPAADALGGPAGRRPVMGQLAASLDGDPGDAGPDGAPSSAPAGMGIGGVLRRVQPAAAPIAAPSGPATGATPVAASGGAAALTQLPDGNGGAVAVPPLALAPAASLSPTPADLTPSLPAASPALPMVSPTPATSVAPAPWDPSAGTFDATHNAIDSVIAPGAGDPSRIDIAKDYYDQFATAADANFGHNLTDATNEAAAHGRLGSGMLTNRYGDLTQQLAQQKELAKRGLITDATEGTIADNRSNRSELRTERGYQGSLAEQAIQRRIAQAAAERGDTQQAFDNAMRQYGLGAGSDPSAALLAASGRAGQESAAAGSSIADLLRLFALRGS